MRARVARIAAGVYGTILVLGIITALSLDAEAGPGEILGGVLATAVVFWLAHVYAETLALRLTAGSGGSLRGVALDVAGEQWPIAEAAFVPSAPLALGAVGALGRSTAITVAIVFALLDLFGWGYAAGRVMYPSPLKAAGSAVLLTGAGLIMVLLKNLVH